MIKVKQVIAMILLGASASLLAACHDDFDYDYAVPPVSVTHSSSNASYGDSSASYGNPSNSSVSYGNVAPVPPVSVTTTGRQGGSSAGYGH